ncbi:D-glycero-alpha-D-manno-heptose-1,7-bisphosphate 7-phosphatase [Achromobacter aloeverae]|uniref:D,D-heptose 1,7-bisphosphate phosphatase n=1 Tax=Achromobacter aloeverae TaxID=1750518 RepID=A0A4Q1HHM8_9BURK|nr:HAD family hydrolase [Achromobacter aloeverae]RXN86174.1 HAD family hydrolase [Achromobacter aloeverae]
MALTPGIFLDKDGTLLCDVPYNVNPDRMRFEHGVEEGLRRLARLGWPLVVVSNQPGVAFGLFDIDALEAVRRRLAVMFRDAGATLTAMYCCPHRPAGYPGFEPCTCRKPAPGLLLRAAAEHGIDLARSWMVGDILDDVEAGARADCRTVLVHNGNETEWLDGPLRRPTLCVTDFDAAARAIEQRARLDDNAAERAAPGMPEAA